MLATDSTPISTNFTVDFSIEKVKSSINYLLNHFPQYFIAKNNGINNELGTYIFERPKGIDTPTIRISLSAMSEQRTSIEIHCSSNSITPSSSDFQIAISEVQNILLAKLNEKTDDELLAIIKKNNSGNGVWGCLKSIGCLVVIVFIIIYIIGMFFNH